MTKMAFEKNDLKGILILVFFAVPMIATTNINCSGRAFHCVNSTHFMICVDLGGGLSTTIDDFVIPCPATTVCHENNIFECDFPEVLTAPPHQVIGVYKQSDTSEPTTVTNSVTPTSDIFSVFKENVISTTLSIPEDVTPVVKLEVLEDIKDPAGVNNDNTTEMILKVTPSFIDSGNEQVNDKQASNKTITTSVTDNNKNLEPAVETLIHKTVNISSTDNSKSIDMVTSVIGLINLISTDPPSVASKKTSSDVLTPLHSLYDNIATTTEQYISKEVTIHGEKVNHVADKLNTPTKIIFTESSVTPDAVSTTPVVNTYNKNNTTEYVNKIGSTNQNIAEKINFSKRNSTSEIVPETTIASVQIVNILEPVTNPKTTTNNTFVSLGLVDLIAADSEVSVPSTNGYAATTTTDQYTTKLETTLSEKPVTAEVISTNPVINAAVQNVIKTEVNNNVFTELNSTGEVTTIEQVPSLQTTIEKTFVPITTEANIVNTTEPFAKSEVLFNNDSPAENQSIVIQPLDIVIRTKSPIVVPDNLYQINEELNLTLVTTKNITIDTINTTKKDKAVFNASSTDIVTEPTLSTLTTIKYPTIEILRAGTSQSALPPTNAPSSVNEPNLENVGTYAILSVYTTPATYNVTTDPVTKTDLTSQSDIVTEPQKAGNKIPRNLNLPANLGTILFQENLNTEKTVQHVVDQTTTYWSPVVKSVITPVPSDVTDNSNLSHIVKPINQDNISAADIVKTQDVLKPKSHEIPLTVSYVPKLAITMSKTVQTTPISVDSTLTVEEVSTYTPEIVEVYRASTSGNKIETSKIFAEDVAHATNAEYVTDIPITTLPPQESSSQIIRTVKLLNTTNSPSDLVSTTFATAGNDVQNTTDLNTSNWKDSVNIDTVSSKVNLNTDVHKTKTVNTIESKNNGSVSSSAINDKDESIKIVSVLDIVNSSGKVMTTGKMQQSSPKPSLSNDYIITTASQDSGAYVSATDNVFDYTLVHVGEFVSQKNPEVTVSLGEAKNSVLSTLSTLPMIEISTEKVQYVGTGAPIPSVIDVKHANPTKIVVDYVATRTNDYASTDAMISQLNKLPIGLAETSPSSVKSVKPSTVVTPVGSTIVPVYDEETTIKDDTFIMSSTVANRVFSQTTPLAVIGKTNQNVPTGIKTTKPQNVLSTVSSNTPLSTSTLPIARVTAEQIITTGPTHTINTFAHTTPLASTGKTNQDVLPGIKATYLPQYVISTLNKNIPLSIPSLPTARVPAAQIITEPAHTTNTLAQTTPLPATGETNQDALNGIKTTEVPHYVTTMKNNIPQPVPALAIAKVTAPQNTTEPTLNIAFAQATPPLALAGKTKQDVPSGIKTTHLPQYLTSTITSNNPQFISDITTENIIDSLAAPDSMVETINVTGDKISDTYLRETISSDIISNNPTVSVNNSVKTVKNMIDHESIIIGTVFKTVKSTDMTKAEIVNHTESNWIGSDVNIDSVKIKESGKEDDKGNDEKEDSKSSVTISGRDIQNLTLASDSSIIPKIEPKDGTPVDKIEYRLTTITTIHSGSESGASSNETQLKPLITKENISDSYNKNNTNSNMTTSLRNLSQQNSTINDELEQHLISTNHTITTEVQSHLNESNKQSNKTNDKVPLSVASMHNSNLTNVKLNASSNDTSAITVPASVFSCTNHTRGKYADKKDCRKFYTCIGNLQPLLGTCPNNTVFSEINKQCTRNLSHCVRNNQFRCLFEGRFGDFFRDNIYYICVKNRLHGFIRYKLQCQADYYLNKDSVKCEKNEEISTQSESSVSETNTDESKPKPESEKIVSTDDFECKKEGKFPYAKDCSKYYVCTKVKDVYRRNIEKCASDEVFDENKKKCVESDSGEC